MARYATWNSSRVEFKRIPRHIPGFRPVLFLFQRNRRSMLCPKPVKRPVLEGPFCAWAIDATSRYFSGVVLLFAVVTLRAAEHPVDTLAPPISAVVNQYCLDCH